MVSKEQTPPHKEEAAHGRTLGMWWDSAPGGSTDQHSGIIVEGRATLDSYTRHSSSMEQSGETR